jgi:hypothetical protein
MKAVRVRRASHFTLWRSTTTPRLRLLYEGRFFDGWLDPNGRLRAWPVDNGKGVRVSFTLSLPASGRKVVRVKIGGRTFSVRGGQPIRVVCGTERGPLDVTYSATGISVSSSDFRQRTARVTAIAVADRSRRGSSRCSR